MWKPWKPLHAHLGRFILRKSVKAREDEAGKKAVVWEGSDSGGQLPESKPQKQRALSQEQELEQVLLSFP